MTDWEIKYKTLRAAFIAWRRIERAEAKIRIKDRQRIIQLCFDGIQQRLQATCYRNYERVMGLLGVSGYSPPPEK